MNIHSEPLPVPEALARLPAVVIAPYGSLVSNSDVAQAFGVDVSTLRKWRQLGSFPHPVHTQAKRSYYKIADLILPYYKRFPGALPDPEMDAEIEAILQRGPFSARDAGNSARDNNSISRENSSAHRENDMIARESPVNAVTEIMQQFQADMLAAIAPTVTEAVRLLVEHEPESPAVIETLSAEMAAQRQQIDSQKSQIDSQQKEIERLKEQLAIEQKWRDKPLLERVMARPEKP